MPTIRLTILFEKYLANTCTPTEKGELSELILSKDHDESITGLLEQAWLNTNGELDMTEDKAEGIFKFILVTETRVIPTIHRIHFRRSRWWAAAAIFIMVSVGSYILFFNKKPSSEMATVETKDVKAPETNRAMITLADGQTIYLDSIANGTISRQGNVNIIKTGDGKIIYNGLPAGPGSHEVVYNTLHNPRGSKVIDMQLSDGSHFWLNAGSSVTYPIAFAGTQRSLSITGEAYFEVSPDKAKPFIVTKGTTSVTVLGTHFNVNAYDDEATINVTLLEGSVKVASPGTSRGEVILKPGQQAQVASTIKVVNDMNLEEVMAWKNGKFEFGESASIEAIMRQVARWYDLDVEYKGTITKHFWGSISRNVNASQVFNMLELTGGVRFKIEGKKVTVLP